MALGKKKNHWRFPEKVLLGLQFQILGLRSKLHIDTLKCIMIMHFLTDILMILGTCLYLRDHANINFANYCVSMIWMKCWRDFTVPLMLEIRSTPSCLSRDRLSICNVSLHSSLLSWNSWLCGKHCCWCWIEV